MVWVAIVFDIQTYIAVLSGTVTAQLYDDDILQLVMLPFLLRHSRLTFQRDNARSHTALVVIIVFKLALYFFGQFCLISFPYCLFGTL